MKYFAHSPDLTDGASRIEKLNEHEDYKAAK